MIVEPTQLAYEATGSFSSLVLDYVQGAGQLQPFYTHPVSVAGIQQAIEQRKLFNTNRELLVNVLQQHYSSSATAAQQRNIGLLHNDHCFTVTTAHQPNIFTGHLYFIYKILHAIKLCEKLKAAMPENDFVPVYYMGSEDADLDELGHVYINGMRHEWKTNQTGAVGRMKVDKELLQMLNAIEGELAIQPHGREIIGLMKRCYTEDSTIEESTFRLVNHLFGQYGLLIFLPDNADYKRVFIPVVTKELSEQFSYPLVNETVSAFPKAYKVQAGGREMNLFYLKDDRRDRIEKNADEFKIVDTETHFNSGTITSELETNPERFSANVILRPVFQEMLLPNVAFIGGGGEIAYWLELKKVFEAVQVPFPVLVLRNSFLWVNKKCGEKAAKLGFQLPDLFKTETELLNTLVKRDSEVQLSLHQEKQAIIEFYSNLKVTAGAVDTTLEPHTESLGKAAIRKIEALEKKMLRAQKKKFEAQQRQIHQLKAALFPHNNLQERIENFMPFYAKLGPGFITVLYQHALSLEQQFTILSET